MVLTFIIAFLSLIGLVVLHEFGHFILAKKFGVKVEEFGIGYPPRIFGKKIGETIYSLNLLPFGAFVKMPGEIGDADNKRSFSHQAVWKRAVIAFGGVLSFWIMAAILFSIVFGLGTQVAIDDNQAGNLINPKVQIAGVASDSPAETAGLKLGDIARKVEAGGVLLEILKVKDLQDFTSQYLGQEISLTVERGGEILVLNMTPRVSQPDGEGPVGVSLVRTAIKSYPWYQAPWQGIVSTVNMTGAILEGYGQAIKNVVSGVPSGVQLTGPIGIFQMLSQAGQLGATYFIQFVGMIAIYIAIFNVLPIPAVDGGKMLFLLIEAIRRRPIPEKIEQNVTAVFFMALLLLMVFVTVKDIIRIF